MSKAKDFWIIYGRDWRLVDVCTFNPVETPAEIAVYERLNLVVVHTKSVLLSATRHE